MFPLNNAEKHSHANEKNMGKQIYKKQLSKWTLVDVPLEQNFLWIFFHYIERDKKKKAVQWKKVLGKDVYREGQREETTCSSKKNKPQTKESLNMWTHLRVQNCNVKS